MATATIHEAESDLSRLIARVEAGEDIVIARDRDPVVRLVATTARSEPRRPGRLKSIPALPNYSFFFDPLPDDELRLWQGHGSGPMD